MVITRSLLMSLFMPHRLIAHWPKLNQVSLSLLPFLPLKTKTLLKYNTPAQNHNLVLEYRSLPKIWVVTSHTIYSSSSSDILALQNFFFFFNFGDTDNWHIPFLAVTSDHLLVKPSVVTDISGPRVFYLLPWNWFCLRSENNSSQSFHVHTWFLSRLLGNTIPFLFDGRHWIGVMLPWCLMAEVSLGPSPAAPRRPLPLSFLLQPPARGQCASP